MSALWAQPTPQGQGLPGLFPLAQEPLTDQDQPSSWRPLEAPGSEPGWHPGPCPVETVHTKEVALSTRLPAPQPPRVLEAGRACTTPALLFP